MHKESLGESSLPDAHAYPRIRLHQSKRTYQLGERMHIIPKAGAEVGLKGQQP